MVTIPIVSGFIGVGQTYLANVVGQRVMQDLRNALYAHLQRMPLRFFTATRTGEIQSRLANDVGGVQSVVTDTASGILSNVVILISTLVAMFVLSWQLTLLSLFLTPLFVYLTYKVGRAARQIARSTQKSLADMCAITEETLSVSGILLSKAFGRQQHEIDRFSDENERLAGLEIRQQMIGRSFFAIVQIFFSITPALVYLVAGYAEPGAFAAANHRGEPSWRSPPCRAACSSPSARCCRSPSRSSPRMALFDGSSSTWTCRTRSWTARRPGRAEGHGPRGRPVPARVLPVRGGPGAGPDRTVRPPRPRRLGTRVGAAPSGNGRPGTGVDARGRRPRDRSRAAGRPGRARAAPARPP